MTKLLTIAWLRLNRSPECYHVRNSKKTAGSPCLARLSLATLEIVVARSSSAVSRGLSLASPGTALEKNKSENCCHATKEKKKHF